MYLLDKPFISDFLIKTIRDNNYKIIATKEAQELVDDNTLNWINEEDAISTIKNNSETSIYSNSENALTWIDQNIGENKIVTPITIFKDKVKFRELIKNIFPDFYFKKIKLVDIQNLSLEDLSFPFVIKPSIGFFSVGVHIVKNEEDWLKAKNELKPEYLKSIYPKNVLNTTHFIIEEFIDGEEYAIDYYHNDKGDVVLLNVMRHLFSSDTDTSDRVYTTSKAIIKKHQVEIEHFLNKVGTQLNLRNFPAHAEIKIDKNGKIVPIEINPLRFGGWCTTGEVLGVSLGHNVYNCFCENKKPEWDDIFKGKEDKNFSVVILDNNSGINPVNISSFNYSKLSNDFENTLLIRELDINKHPVFGFAFTESSSSNQKELSNILTSDLKKYITHKLDEEV